MAAIAATLLPMVIQSAPDIIKLIAGLVHSAAPAAEVNNGPGTGPVKFAEVFGKVMTALQTAAAAGQIPKTLPSDETVQIIIQAVVTSMQISGVLDSSVAASAAPSANQTLTLKAGQSVTVTVQ